MNFLSLFTPINIAEEKDKFLSSATYNPQFKYDWNLDEYKEYISKHPSKKEFAEAIISQDSNLIVSAAKHYFKTDLDKSTKNSAEMIVENGYQPFESAKDDPQKVYDAILEALKFFKIDYKVEFYDAHGFNVRPSHKYKSVIVSKNASLGLFSLDTTVKHEITHIIRYINKEYNNIARSKNHLSTEEGLASYIGDYKSVDGFNSKFHHAAEYLATEIALNGSLRDVYSYFISLKYPVDFSWQRTIRHKFGFSDTSKSGDIMKPAMYFFYENKIKDLSNEDIIKLFSGKISLDDLSNVKEYSGIVPKEKLVKYFNLQV